MMFGVEVFYRRREAFVNFYDGSQNYEKQLLVSSCLSLSVCRPVHRSVLASVLMKQVGFQ
jgi:hypothetical protein